MKNYEMITVLNYINTYEPELLNVSDNEILTQLEKYLLEKQRNDSNAKIIEELLA